MTDEHDLLVDRCNSLSFLIGMIAGGLNQLITDHRVAEFQKEPIKDLYLCLMNRIDELFYKEKESESR